MENFNEQRPRNPFSLKAPLEHQRQHLERPVPWLEWVSYLHPGLGTEHLPGALCSGTGSPALGLCSP